VRSFIYIVFIAIFLTVSCKKEGVNLQEELMQGAWQFIKVEDNTGNIILDGEGEPLLLFFFKENGDIIGRLKGIYSVQDNDYLYFQAEIDPFTPIFGGQFDSLANYPQRYYDFEAITKNGIEGKVSFFENGFDSQFSIQYETDKKMWFERY
jgi:hypothetical protein